MDDDSDDDGAGIAAYAVEPDDWGPIYFACHRETGWTYQQIGELTFPQLVSWQHKGSDPVPKIVNPKDIKGWINKVREMKRSG